MMSRFATLNRAPTANAGALYDHFGFYAPAFAAGTLFNLANLVVVGFLVARQAREPRLPAVLPA